MSQAKMNSALRLAATAGTYILDSVTDRDRMYILFDLWREDFHKTFRRALELGELIERVSDPEAAGFRMLDLACGEGLVSADLLERYPNLSIVAIDRDPEACAAGRIGYEHLANLRIYPRDAYDPLPAELAPDVSGRGFELALLRLALTHFTDGAKVLRNVYEALLPGGVVLFFDPTITTYENFPHPSFRVLNQAACAGWKYFGTYDAGNQQARIAAEAGFEVLESIERRYEVGGESAQGQAMLKLGIETLLSMRKGLVERARIMEADDFDRHIQRLKTECPPSLSGSWDFHQTVARKPR